MTQPPQVAKCGQGGATRSAEGESTASASASSTSPRLPTSRARTVSPGRVPGRNTVLPSRRAMPSPAAPSASIVSSKESVIVLQWQMVGGEAHFLQEQPERADQRQHGGDQQRAQQPGDPQAEEDTGEGGHDQRAEQDRR